MEPNMLCAKYNYKMDIAVKQEEAYQDGLDDGQVRKAVEDAVMLVQKYNTSPETAAKDMDAPLEAVLEKLK